MNTKPGLHRSAEILYGLVSRCFSQREPINNVVSELSAASIGLARPPRLRMRVAISISRTAKSLSLTHAEDSFVLQFRIRFREGSVETAKGKTREEIIK